ncbi:bifunctional precorrin-2 dehydrogenase/sirohydrochlorin ferrochelatase [Thermus sp.]|uniref:precorrin-2 dehydrogenase/sirohydrochlorin ferrochelatase family protein n=1 Tax=Thermus sp. TaxID=275 RepID=UPI0026038D30|nr:bifunctional precorrin-2 dehydrogenase/sirohydrochlorin ferrochelatase [Thermus sp.]MCX7848888.1 bifunctional precorrin-2 dehydrogenase/sirohydrochlorin ferrochelatase [Thermus sp.]
MGYFPLMLDLRGKPVLLVGGGPETPQKLRALLEAGAEVTVLAQEDPGDLEALAQEGRIRWVRRGYRRGDLGGFFLVVSHPKDKAIHPEVRREAEERRIFLVAVDDPENASAILPAVLRRGELVVALSTSGAAPALAVRLKERFAALLPLAYGELVAYLRTLRPRIAQIPDFEARKRLWYRIVDQALEALELDPKEGLPKAMAKAEAALEEVWTR